jgi:hypothetical protein
VYGFLEDALQEGASVGAILPRERLRAMLREYDVARGGADDGYLPPDVMLDLSADPPREPTR